MGASRCPPHLLCPRQLTLGYVLGQALGVLGQGLWGPVLTCYRCTVPPPRCAEGVSVLPGVHGVGLGWALVLGVLTPSLCIGFGWRGPGGMVLLLVLLPAWLRRV